MDFGNEYRLENEQMLTDNLGIKTHINVDYNGFEYETTVALIFNKNINVLEDFHSPQNILDFVYNELSNSKFIEELVEYRLRKRLEQQEG